MKLRLMGLALLMVLVGCKSPNTSQEGKKKVGIIKWAEHPALNDSVKGAVEVLGDDVVVIEKSAQDDLSTASMILSQFKDEGVDVVYAIATPAAQMALEALDVPIVFSAVTDPFAANLMNHPEKTIVGVSDEPALKEQMALVRRLMPNATSVGVLYNTSEANSIAQLEVVKSLAQAVGLSVKEQGVSEQSEIGMAAEALSSKVDVMYIMNDNLVVSNTAQVTKVSNAKQVPVFTAEDGAFSEGGLATITVSYYDMGKEAGKMILSVMNNETISNPVVYGKEMGSKLFLNRTLATEFGIEIPSDLVIENDN